MGFMGLITATVPCARSQYSLLSVSARRVLVVILTLLDLRAEESHVLRRLKPPRCGEASKKHRALSRVRTQVIGALAHGFTRRATRAPHVPVRFSSLLICVTATDFAGRQRRINDLGCMSAGS